MVIMDETEDLKGKVLHLRQVEKLSYRQIAYTLGIDHKKVGRILQEKELAKAMPRKSILDKYIPLIAQWYKQYPRLMAKQVYEKLKSYGYSGGYKTVVRASLEYRKIKKESYHALTFLPGQEAQVDWFFFNHERLGKVAGFVYILSYSRYAWGIFYPRHSFEFFLAGHLECFKQIGGVAHCHRYDNCSSVVLKHTSEQIVYNPQFLDFARFYTFSLHACNTYSGNEKGRVERLVRIAREFLYGETFMDLADLNRKFHLWLEKRNNTIHRSTDKTPKDLLTQEKLVPLPLNPYLPRRVIMALVSKTALVEFETNKYSVPTTCTSKTVEIMAYPERIEICLAGGIVARHKRCFGKKQTIQNPLHAEKLLKWTPKFKSQRILELMTQMDESLNHFLIHQEDDTARVKVAYQLFVLLKDHSRAMLISAVKELNDLKCFKLKALLSLLNLPQSKQGDPLWPQNKDLLDLNYEERNLTDYDDLT
jgi:transposase